MCSLELLFSKTDSIFFMVQAMELVILEAFMKVNKIYSLVAISYLETLNLQFKYYY